LWAASSWQSQYRRSLDAPYGTKTVQEYIHRPRFELYHISEDPEETVNLADDPKQAAVLLRYKEKLKAMQRQFADPWITKWDYE
ncbi:MAG TPA: heparan N-sulfatase, partial [Verrucomicrobiales bacterium]|nr:heparan N-sulfatase [Verrucomicrobiales bacterium]